MDIALKKAGMTMDDMELIEINEAFAAQVIACHRKMPFDMERLNVHGGAIALGHPIGASGAKNTDDPPVRTEAAGQKCTPAPA